MEKQHYIYRMVNDTTGEFYIGQRTCKGTAWLDGKYKGSGKVIKRKVKAHPEQWKKEILCFAASHEMLNELEILCIGDAWRDDPKCLNLTPGGDGKSEWTEEERAAQAARAKAQFESEEARAAQSARTKAQFASEEARAANSARRKKYFESEEARAAQSAKMKKYFESEEARAALSVRSLEQIKVRLTSPEGDRVEIARSLVLDYLLRDYTFTQRIVCVQNDELRQYCHYNGKKAVALLLSDSGWTYGANIAYTRVGMKQVEESLK